MKLLLFVSMVIGVFSAASVVFAEGATQSPIERFKAFQANMLKETQAKHAKQLDQFAKSHQNDQAAVEAFKAKQAKELQELQQRQERNLDIFQNYVANHPEIGQGAQNFDHRRLQHLVNHVKKNVGIDARTPASFTPNADEQGFEGAETQAQ